MVKASQADSVTEETLLIGSLIQAYFIQEPALVTAVEAEHFVVKGSEKVIAFLLRG